MKLAQRYYGLRSPQIHSKLSHSKSLYLKRELCQQRGLWSGRGGILHRGFVGSKKSLKERIIPRRWPQKLWHSEKCQEIIWVTIFGVCVDEEDWKGKKTITVFLTLAPLLKALSRELGQGKF